ncbi:YtxH domain-containing protein [Wenyingzhuangia sp. IMCC45533]
MSSTTGKIITSLLAGLAIGATAGILFAPQKGVETQKSILNKITELKNEILSLVAKGEDYASEKITVLRDKIASLEKQLKEINISS